MKLENLTKFQTNELSEKYLAKVLGYARIACLKEISIKELTENFGFAVEDESLLNKRFDYFCPDLNLIIEFDGDQHFKPVDYFGGEAQLIQTQYWDLVKSNFAKSNNIRMLRFKEETTVADFISAMNQLTTDEINNETNNVESVSLFMNYIFKLGADTFDVLPINVLYEHYKEIQMINDPENEPITRRAFADSLKTLSFDNFHFSQNIKRLTALSDSFDLNTYNKITRTTITVDKRNQTSCLIKKSNVH